ncbi:uncharacterized protein At2g29880-like [Argentina anserina]|uniref:uncharacterized protein At2g29880-like n=1 Tax=Argentina anserina TaxID=57926 RepID=UPI0021767E36|nr:uncharacterized protein At2g29880-like [Potentilla anserina]
MDSQVNTGSAASRTGGKKVKPPNRTWTKFEDVALVEALTEICQAGSWKANNGFKAGYLGEFERIIQRKLPSSGLKADSHIVSRVKTLKKQTLAISEMITNSSGFSWDHENKMISHKDAKGLRLRPFIHYDHLVEAFGKDRANRLKTEGLAEVEENLNNDDESLDLEGDGLAEDVVPTPATHTPSAPSATQTRKRPRDAYYQCLGDMASTLRSFVDVTKTHLETMKEVLLKENSTSMKRGKLVEELMKIDGMNDLLVLDAATNIIKDDSKVELFFSLPDNLKGQMVYNLLNP